MWYIHTVGYYTAENEGATWHTMLMDLISIIWNKKSQTHKEFIL